MSVGENSADQHLLPEVAGRVSEHVEQVAAAEPEGMLAAPGGEAGPLSGQGLLEAHARQPARAAWFSNLRRLPDTLLLHNIIIIYCSSDSSANLNAPEGQNLVAQQLQLAWREANARLRWPPIRCWPCAPAVITWMW